MSASRYMFHIDTGARCIFTKYVGELTYGSFIDRTGKAESHSDFDPDFHSIADVSGCDVRMSGDEIRDVAYLVGKIYKGQDKGKDAFIVDSVIAHGLMRMFTGSIPNHQAQTQIFDVSSQGITNNLRKWLDLPEQYSFPDFINVG